ncbi:MAG: helix-turn-helix domain-containing protein [Dehalococcoidia bacterium]
MNGDELLTVAQVAERLHAHPETVRRWLSQGRLHGVMPGGKRLGWRIAESELRRFLAQAEGTEATS